MKKKSKNGKTVTCDHCNHPIYNARHNQLRHGRQADITSCAYLKRQDLIRQAYHVKRKKFLKERLKVVQDIKKSAPEGKSPRQVQAELIRKHNKKPGRLIQRAQ